MADVVMPRLSDSMEEGTILRWLRSVGDALAVGDELVEIETDKANMAYESDVAGTLMEILAAEGETLPIGAPIARVGEGGAGAEQITASPRPPEGAAGSSLTQTAPPLPPPKATEAPGTAGAGARQKASPVARRMAKERGIDLSRLRGSGPGGRIVKTDIERAQAEVPAARAPAPAGENLSGAPETAKGQTTYRELSKLQSTIARRMAESKATAPHFYLEAEVDMSRAVEARARIKAGAGDGVVVPSFNDMVVKACALALRQHPRANGAYRDGRFELFSRVNVGVAVAGQDALVVATVFDADRKGLGQIASESRALAQRVRDGEITPPELSGATFTVSNLGMYGIDRFSAVINPPQAAILAVGAIRERPVLRDGEIGAAHLMQVTLACDHRILYGADGAEFLAGIRTLLEEPLALAL
ncbi:MAG: dihydrolipoamide acetyltransferase family protein [Solirubrobacterales bacterium]